MKILCFAIFCVTCVMILNLSERAERRLRVSSISAIVGTIKIMFLYWFDNMGVILNSGECGPYS